MMRTCLAGVLVSATLTALSGCSGCYSFGRFNDSCGTVAASPAIAGCCPTAGCPCPPGVTTSFDPGHGQMLVPGGVGMVVPGDVGVVPQVTEVPIAPGTGMFSPSYLGPPLTSTPQLVPVPGGVPQALPTPYVPPQ
ncbi:MAG: hypothetical protein ACFCD0_29350 [Gemmataceae bacterium]